MVNASNNLNASREIDGAMGHSEAMSYRSVDSSAINTENGLLRYSFSQKVNRDSRGLLRNVNKT
jgi:hypothetical protein